MTLLAATEVRNNDQSIPTTLMLSQNYPNPFNPTTMLVFLIPALPAGPLEVAGGVASVSRGGRERGENQWVLGDFLILSRASRLLVVFRNFC